MEFDGDALIIDLGMSMDEVREFETFVRQKLDYICSIVAREPNAPCSGALLSLLAGIKKSSPNINIDFLQNGFIESELYGRVEWGCHE